MMYFTFLFRLEQCPAGWGYFNGSCYSATDASTTRCYSFEEARQHCSSMGADIVQIASKAESDFILEKQYIGWLGFYRSSNGMWMDKKYPSYMNWFDEEPRPNQGNCVLFSRDDKRAGWKADKCESCRSVMCKKGSWI